MQSSLEKLFEKHLKKICSLMLLTCLIALTGCKESRREALEAEVHQGDDKTTQVFGEYTVHYKAFNSTFLQPDVAAVYGFERNPKKGLLNVAILRDNGTSKEAVEARFAAQAVSLAGQAEKLEFKKVDEGHAIYYLAPFTFFNEEVLKFTVDAHPETAPAETFTVRFQQKFYQD